ncbi:hypothetical protein PIB30_042631 [Stylosanthes scabra]|uniref:Transmembrane protein n=1 Tax=Stylosanthes scabra TaxID=79078 RepID=A0ABU6ZE14_9FABA|nr:hypothetical protein [Stylosanthes scabra]
MRCRLWKRKQEPAIEEPPEDGSSVIKSSENNSVQLLEGSGSVNNEFRPRNSDFRPVNSELRPINSELRPANSRVQPPRNDFLGSDEYNNRQKRDLLWLAIFLCIIVIVGAYVVLAHDPVEDEVLTTDTESGSEDDIYQHLMIVGLRNDEPLPPMNNLPGSEEYNNQEKREFQCIALLLCIVVILAVYVTLGIGEHYASKRSFV